MDSGVKCPKCKKDLVPYFTGKAYLTNPLRWYFVWKCNKCGFCIEGEISVLEVPEPKKTLSE